MPTLTTSSPLKDAVAMLNRKTPVGSAMSSSEWAMFPADVRMRAMFSARVENERILADMQQRLQARISLAQKDGRTMDRGVFIEEMRDELTQAGYKRGDAKRGSLQDLKSTRRLGLIWDMNLAQAQGYARWKADMTPEGLENEPCYEFIRVMERMEVRDWPLIWEQAGGRFFDGPGSNDDYPFAKGRMMAAKTDGIWKRISRFNTPWPPYDWGSGMGLRGVDRDESELLGVIDPADVLVPEDEPFNETTVASLRGIPAEGRERIERALLGDVILQGDEIRIAPADRPQPGMAIPRIPAVLAEAAPRATAVLAEWPERDLERVMQAIRRTVAYARIRQLAAEAGGQVNDVDFLTRAMIQFQAGASERAAILSIRQGPIRDLQWTDADFSEVRGILAQVTGGAR
jgi:hypothetical protein